MRRMMMAAVGAALLGLVACDSKTSNEAAAPAAPKSMARMAQMYAGQEQITKVDSATVAVDKDGLTMEATGAAAAPGYTNAGFLPRINAAPPKDGIYEVDVVADKPANAVPAATPIDVKGAWSGYPADHLKGVKFITKTNSVVTMLPAK